MQYEVHVRQQKPKHGRSRFAGPDTYVAVTIAPDGVEVPYPLNHKVLRKRGIKIEYFGEGYKKHNKTPRSMLYRAISEAEAYVDLQERGDQALTPICYAGTPVEYPSL